ncbi:hypothetical protein [Kistimonas asteriae]|uniref:hypothetical protein n=1 Tax=Kistimonas asteriae TaxID=517724 RepID=UPI001BA8FFD9|nr:hypothetical protein [Kistimonas asteriae]
MANQATCDRSASKTLAFSVIDKNIHDSDFIYMDRRSLKKVPPTVTNVLQTQDSLRKLLCEKLNNAGRKSLANRLSKKNITYKELKSLTQQINNPRTKQTLLNNSTKLFSTIPYENLPSVVREDIEKKDIPSIPENIHILHQIMTCHEFEMHSIALIKHFTTQCMQIDFNSPFETLEEEYSDCARLLLTPGSNTEEVQLQMCYIKNLESLHDIWKQQNPADWNQVLLQHTSQAPSPRFIGPEDVQVDEVQSLEKDSPSQWQGITTIPTLSPIEPKTTIQKEPEHLLRAQVTLPQILTCTQEQAISATAPLTVDKIEKGKDDNSDSTITKSDTVSEPKVQQQEEQADMLPGAHKPTQPDVRPKIQTRDKSRVTESSKGSEKKPSEESQLPPAKEQHQRPTFTPLSAIPEMGLDFTNEEDFNNHLAERTLELHNLFMQQEDAVLQYIQNPGNRDAFMNALRAVNTGPWISSRLYTLLKQAADITSGVNNPFRSRLNALIDSNAFFNGQPPKELSTGKVFMALEENKKLDGTMLFYCHENISPTEALGSFPKYFSVLDSDSAAFLAFFFSFHDYLGQFFDIYARDECDIEFDIVRGFFLGTYSRIKDIKLKLAIVAPLDSFLEGAGTPPQKGSILFAKNHKEYKNRHINHQYELLTMICTSKQTQETTFTAPGLFTDLNKDKVDELLVALYNQDPAIEEMISKSLWNKLHRHKSALYYGWNTPPGNMSSEKLRKDGGGLNIEHPAHIDFESLQSFKNKKLKEQKAKEKSRKKRKTQEKKDSSQTSTKPSTPSMPKRTKTKRKTERKFLREQNPHKDKQTTENPITSLEMQQKELQQLCQKRELVSVSEIKRRASNISKRMQEMENQNIQVPDELKYQIDQNFRTAEEIHALAPLETIQLKLHNLCEKRNLQSLHEISETEKSARGLMQEMEDKDIKIPDTLKRQIDQDFRVAQEIRKIAPLERLQSKLHKLCEKRNLQSAHEITETENSTRELMQEMKNKGVKIPDDLQSQFDKDCQIAEEMREAAPLVQMQRRIHKLWKEGRKLSPQEQEINKAINEARTLIDTLKVKGVPIPEEFIDLLERDIRDAKKLLSQ